MIGMDQISYAFERMYWFVVPGEPRHPGDHRIFANHISLKPVGIVGQVIDELTVTAVVSLVAPAAAKGVERCRAKSLRPRYESRRLRSGTRQGIEGLA